MTNSGYAILAGRHRCEETIEKSRFLTTLAPVATADEARAFVQEVSVEFKDATHNCWAFRIGAPSLRANIGMSDDGEPHGTAGRPMLDVLLGSDVGDVAAVVTRWFGGTKLGKGGLVRAYGDCVKHALDSAPRTLKIDWEYCELEFDYERLRAVAHQHPKAGVEVLHEEFAQRVVQRVRVPRDHLDRARALWLDATAGKIEIRNDVGSR